jgi:hypothetical protein
MLSRRSETKQKSKHRLFKEITAKHAKVTKKIFKKIRVLGALRG